MLPTNPKHPRFASRLRMIRKHLALGKRTPWPDGLDWANWKERHELWFSKHEVEWLALAAEASKREAEEAKEAAKTAVEESKPEKPRRQPLWGKRK